MRIINGVECRTKREDGRNPKRFVEYLDEQQKKWVCVGHVKRYGKEWHFAVYSWVFDNNRPMFGDRGTLRECLQVIIAQLERDNNADRDSVL